MNSKNALRRGDLPPTSALRAFDAVAQLGGIRRAAAALDIDHSAVSRHIRSLEVWLDRQLVVRRGRNLELTEDGRCYHALISPALRTIADATARAMSSAKIPVVTIWSVPGFATQWLAPRLGEFRAAHPELEIVLRPTDQFVQPGQDGPEIEIRWNLGSAALAEKERTAVRLCAPEQFPVASPDFLARHPPIRTAADLLALTLLHEASAKDWQDWLAANGIDASGGLTGPRFWYANLTLQAACLAQGVALTTRLVAGDELQSGRLVAVDGSEKRFVQSRQTPYHLVVPSRRWNEPAVTTFRNWLLDRLQAEGFLDD